MGNVVPYSFLIECVAIETPEARIGLSHPLGLKPMLGGANILHRSCLGIELRFCESLQVLRKISAIRASVQMGDLQNCTADSG